MRIIKRTTIAELMETLSKEAASSLMPWVDLTEEAEWTQFNDVRKTFSDVDQVLLNGQHCLIFNIARNRYRLVCAIHYSTRIVFVRWFGTHAAYGRNEWHAAI